MGISIRSLIRFLAGLPYLLRFNPAFMADVVIQCAPRNLKPSLVAVIMVFSLFRLRPHSSASIPATWFLIILASSTVPIISMTKSSAYLMYIIRLKLGSCVSTLGVALRLATSILISGDPGCVRLSLWILDCSFAYSLFFSLLVPLSNLSLSLAIRESSSCRTMFDRSGLSTLPCGVPSVFFTSFSVVGSMYPAVRDFLISCKVLSHLIFDSMRFMIISWGILSKHLLMSPWITHL